MNRRSPTGADSSLRQLGPVAALAAAFFLGGLLGSLLAGLIGGEGAQALESFLRDYLAAARGEEIALPLASLVWEQGRFYLGTCLLGLTALGVAGIPALFFLRGFLFSFSVAAFCRIFGPAGLASAFFLFGLPAVWWAPVLFLTGSQCLSGASALLRRALGDSRTPLPHGSGCWWGRLAAYGLALCLGAGLEWAAAPLLLKAAAQFV